MKHSVPLSAWEGESMSQTVKAARNNMRRIAYQVGGHGVRRSCYSMLTDRRSPRVDHYTTRCASVGTVFVPWKHPLYWAPDGTWIDD